MKRKLLFISTFILFAFSVILAQNLTTQPSSKAFIKSSSGNSKVSTVFDNERINNAPSDVVYDSIYYYTTDSTKKWTPVSKAVDLLYNANKDRISTTFKSLENQIWVNSNKHINTFDSNNQLINNLSQNWDKNAGWINSSQTIITYNANKNQTEVLMQMWSPFTDSWDNFFRTLYIYDNNNNRISYESQSWRNNNWLAISRVNSFFNSNNKIESENVETYVNSIWVKRNENRYYYDSHDNRILSEGYKDSVKYDSTISAFDAKNQEIFIDYFGKTGSSKNWVERMKTSNTYNLNGDLTHSLDKNWQSGIFYTAYFSTLYYNSLNQLTDDAVFRWEYPGTHVETGDSSHYYLHDPLAGISDTKPVKNNIVIYPNPSNGTFSVSTENKRIIQTLEVYNVIGERILQQHQSNQVTIPNAQAGIYFVKIDDGTGVYTKKITVQ